MRVADVPGAAKVWSIDDETHFAIDSATGEITLQEGVVSDDYPVEITLTNECDYNSRTITFTVEGLPCEGAEVGTCTGTTIGTWDWVGDNSALDPMAAGEMSFDGGPIPLFNAIDNTSTDRTSALEALTTGNVVCISDGTYKVFGTVQSAQDETNYWSIYWTGSNANHTGEFCAFGSSGTVTMTLVS